MAAHSRQLKKLIENHGIGATHLRNVAMLARQASINAAREASSKQRAPDADGAPDAGNDSARIRRTSASVTRRGAGSWAQRSTGTSADPTSSVAVVFILIMLIRHRPDDIGRHPEGRV
jgi:hypothetical protein